MPYRDIEDSSRIYVDFKDIVKLIILGYKQYKAAHILNIAPKTLHRKMIKYLGHDYEKIKWKVRIMFLEEVIKVAPFIIDEIANRLTKKYYEEKERQDQAEA